MVILNEDFDDENDDDDDDEGYKIAKNDILDLGLVQKGLRLSIRFLNTQFAIELRLISIVQLIVTLCETGPW